MFTDIVGYTALTQADESTALKLLERHNGLLRPFFPRFHGREIKTEGDKFLVEFDSALDATTCAVELQRLLYEHNLSAGADAKIVIRIGIHLGDVVHTGDDILGDSVNIASRIEPLATPGGICVTEPVYSQVRNKIPNRLEKLAPQTLKNVRFPIDVYQVVLPWLAGGASPVGGDHPRLAVLPFSNISPDPKDDYISDGLTEELITVISQLPGVRVIARTSVMQYRATTKAVAQIGAELGASSILEGSVRKAGNRLRITAQLIDASSQEHLWASTYERELNDVFAVQAEIAKQVAEALRIELRPQEEARLDTRRSVRPESYLAYLKGRALLYPGSRNGQLAAKEQFELAISLDPQNGAAYAGLATVVRRIGWFFDPRPREVWDAEGRHAAARALELEPNLSEAHTALSLIYWDDFDYGAAEREVKRALALNPSNAEAHYVYAMVLEDLARAEEAIVEHQLAAAADPLGGETLDHYATLLIWLGRTDEALPVIERRNRLIADPRRSHDLLSDYHLARGDHKRALEEVDLQLAEGTDPDDVSGEWQELTIAWRCFLIGDKTGARSVLAKVESSPAGPLSLYLCGLYYAQLGDIDGCFRCWERAARNRGLPAQGLRLDPTLEPVRKDPRFPHLLHELGLA